MQQAAQAAADSFSEHTPIGRDVICLVAVDMGRIGAWLPVAARVYRSSRTNDEDASPGQAGYVLDCRRSGIAAHEGAADEPRGDLFRRHALRHVGQRQKADLVAGEGKEVLAPMVKQSELPHVVAPEHEPLCAFVPDREGEIAEQMLGAIVAPFLVGMQDERAVGHVAQLLRRNLKRRCQVIAIVEAAVRDKCEVGLGISQRLTIEQIFVVHS